MKIDIDEIERNARSAEQDEWQWRSDDPDVLEGKRAAQVVLFADHENCELLVSSSNRRHIAANSPPVTLALIAELRELRSAADRAVTIADEAFGLGPVEPIDDTLGRIERGINAQHQRIRELEMALTAAASVVESWVQSESQHADYHDDLDWKSAQAMRRLAAKGMVLP